MSLPHSQAQEGAPDPGPQDLPGALTGQGGEEPTHLLSGPPFPSNEGPGCPRPFQLGRLLCGKRWVRRMAVRPEGGKQAWVSPEAEARPTESQPGRGVRARAPPNCLGIVPTQGVSQGYELTASSLPPWGRLMGSEVTRCTKCLPEPSHLADTPGLSQEEPQSQPKARSLTLT